MYLTPSDFTQSFIICYIILEKRLAQLTASQLLLDELVLLEGLQADGVHAMATADVTGVEPIDFQRGGGRVQPAEEVVVSVAKRIGPQGVFNTWKTKNNYKILLEPSGG
jgi:hypothetical protein